MAKQAQSQDKSKPKTKKKTPKKTEKSTKIAQNGAVKDILTLTIGNDAGSFGDVVIALKPEVAPNHVARISKLVAEGFYDGIVFHRVIEGFMAQTGDPTGTGMGGSDYPDLMAEFSETKHIRGTVSMARSSNPNSANSQFFICFAPSSWLDGEYSVWGQVISGMEFVDQLPKGDGQGGMVANPGKIIKAVLGSSKSS